MGIFAEAEETLKTAERSIRELLTKAVSAGEYDEVILLGEWAKQLSSLLDAAAQASGPTAPETVRLGSPPLAATRATSKGRAARKPNYPKFFRDGDTIVKVGWSKAEKSEYEHRASRSALAVLVAGISRLGTGGRRFVMEQLLPLKNPDGAEVPAYQAYLCLAWLRSIGVVTQHGRRGYSIRKGCDLQSSIEQDWRRVPHK